MYRLSLHPWLRLMLATLVVAWSGYGAVVRGEGFQQDLTLRLDARGTSDVHRALDVGTAAETTSGAAALTYALAESNGAASETLDTPGGHEAPARPSVTRRAHPGFPAGSSPAVAGARLPLRHLLCVYRL